MPTESSMEEKSKYNKRIEEILEDAEIEAELAAEKKVRSKNTRYAILLGTVVVLIVGAFFWTQSKSGKQLPLEPSTPELAQKPPAIPPLPANNKKEIPLPPIRDNVVEKPKPEAVAPKTPETSEGEKTEKETTVDIKKFPDLLKELEKPVAEEKSPPARTAEKPAAAKADKPAKATAVAKPVAPVAPKPAPAKPAAKAKPKDEVASLPPAKPKPAPAPSAKQQLSPPAPAAADEKGYFVQLGAFGVQKNAQNLSDRLSALGFHPRTTPINKGASTMYAVQVGPFPNSEQAREAQEKLAKNGFGKTLIRFGS